MGVKITLGPPEPLKVWLVVISHKHGTEEGVFLTEEGSDKFVREFMANDWESQVGWKDGAPESPEGLTLQEMRDWYFEDNDDERIEVWDHVTVQP